MSRKEYLRAWGSAALARGEWIEWYDLCFGMDNSGDLETDDVARPTPEHYGWDALARQQKDLEPPNRLVKID